MSNLNSGLDHGLKHPLTNGFTVKWGNMYNTVNGWLLSHSIIGRHYMYDTYTMLQYSSITNAPSVLDPKDILKTWMWVAYLALGILFRRKARYVSEQYECSSWYSRVQDRREQLCMLMDQHAWPDRTECVVNGTEYYDGWVWAIFLFINFVHPSF